MSRNEIESIFNLWNGGFGSDFDLRPPNVIRDGWLTVHVSRTSGNAFIVKFSRTAGKGCHGHRLQRRSPSTKTTSLGAACMHFWLRSWPPPVRILLAIRLATVKVSTYLTTKLVDYSQSEPLE